MVRDRPRQLPFVTTDADAGFKFSHEKPICPLTVLGTRQGEAVTVGPMTTRTVELATLPATRSPLGAPSTGQMCVAVKELREGDGATIGRALRRRGNTRVIVLARRAGKRELVGLLGNGIRGAVVAESMVPVVARRPLVLMVPRVEEVNDSDPSTGDVTLTPRELGVLQLVAAGHTNRQIGEQLSLSALTVKSHLARISRKMGTGERAELVAIAMRRGLLI